MPRHSFGLAGLLKAMTEGQVGEEQPQPQPELDAPPVQQGEEAGGVAPVPPPSPPREKRKKEKKPQKRDREEDERPTKQHVKRKPRHEADAAPPESGEEERIFIAFYSMYYQHFINAAEAEAERAETQELAAVYEHQHEQGGRQQKQQNADTSADHNKYQHTGKKAIKTQHRPNPGKPIFAPPPPPPPRAAAAVTGGRPPPPPRETKPAPPPPKIFGAKGNEKDGIGDALAAFLGV